MELLLNSSTQPTTAELANLAGTEAQTTRAGDVMQAEVFSVEKGTPLEEIARLMLQYEIDRIPVVRA